MAEYSLGNAMEKLAVTPNGNNINLVVQRPVAKASIYYDNPAILNLNQGTLSGLKYRILKRLNMNINPDKLKSPAVSPAGLFF